MPDQPVRTVSLSLYDDYAIFDVQFWQGGQLVADDAIDATLPLQVFARSLPLPQMGDAFLVLRDGATGKQVGGMPRAMEPWQDPNDPTWFYAVVPANTFVANNVYQATIRRVDDFAVASSVFKTLP